MSLFKRVVAVIYFSLGLLSLYAQSPDTRERKVISLSQIDHLIELKDYTSALSELSLYIKVHPDQFDKAQKRIAKIMRARTKFNLQAVQLAEKMRISAEGNNLTDEEINELDVQKMDIIFAMEKSEENPAQEEIDLTNDARRTIKLSFYINRSNIIVNQGSSLVTNAAADNPENYLKAVEKFKEGLNLKTNDSDIVFQGEDEIPVVYPDLLKKDVDNHINTLKNYTLSLKNQMDACQTAFNEYETIVKAGDLTNSEPALEKVKKSFERLASTRNYILKEGDELRRLDEKALSLNPGLGDTSYITFSRWAVLGVDRNPDSGIIGAVDAFWNTRTESMKNTVYEAVISSFEKQKEIYNADSGNLFLTFDSAPLTELRTAVRGFASQGIQVQNLYSLLNNHKAASFTEYNKSMTFASNFAGNSQRNLYSTCNSIRLENYAVSTRKVINDDFTKFGNDNLISAQFYENQLAVIDRYKNDSFIAGEKSMQPVNNSGMEISFDETDNESENEASQKVQSEKRTDAGVNLEDVHLSLWSALNEYESLVELADKECRKQAGAVWSITAKTYSEEADKKYIAFSIRNAEAQSLLNGVEEVTDDVIFVKYYPTQAVNLCTKLNSDIIAARTVLSQYRIALDGGSAYRDTEEVYSSSIINLESVINNLNSMLQSSNQIIAQGKIKANEALRSSNKAKLSYDQAIKFLKKNLYEEARQALSDADSSYKQSLALEENDSFRKEFGPKIAAADEEITVSQNEWVITTVRGLINDAYNEYYNGNFENSKRDLDEAAVVWEKTQVNENSEIQELLVLVIEALESAGGKEIAFSDPLYKDMGAYLNNASVHYDEGQKLYNSGKSDEGLTLLSTARDEVRKVQRVFPKNLEANNLTLKINKILDPELYNNTVSDKIKKALIAAGSAKDIDQKNALNELKELKAVIGEHKELNSAIKDVESTIAKNAQSERKKAEMAESLALTKQAQAEKNVARKIALLDRALSLNKRNTQAQALKDAALKTNTKTTIVKNYLSDSDTEKFELAERYYNEQRKVEAEAIIKDLYARNPQNPKVKKLKSRIENM